MIEIIQNGHKALREVSQEVPLEHIQSKTVKNVLLDMNNALASQIDGVALAAPQINEPLRIFIVIGKVFGENESNRIFINPILTKASKKMEEMGEGCLSVRGKYGKVNRHIKAIVSAYDENGKKFTLGASGLLAQIFQHEIDHLNGELYIDKATEVNDVIDNIDFAFLGTSKFATIILDELSKKNLKPSLVITTPDKRAGRGMQFTSPPVKIWADEHEVECLQPEKLDDDFISSLQPATYNLFIVAAYGKLIPEDILNIPKLGSINVHPSLLPHHRGPSPIEGQILADDQNDIGVSIMQLDKEMDHGPLLAQTQITPNSWPIKKEELENMLAHEGGSLLAYVLPEYVVGNVELHEQDHDVATFTKMIEKKDALLDLENDDDRTNYLKILAYDKNPRAYFFDDSGKRVIVTDADFKDEKLILKSVIPEGKKEIACDIFLKS